MVNPFNIFFSFEATKTVNQQNHTQFSIFKSIKIFHFVGQAIYAKRKELEQLEKELEEVDRQLAEEQAEIDNIAEEEREMIKVYQSNIREMDLESLRYEAETAEIVSKSTKQMIPFIELKQSTKYLL